MSFDLYDMTRHFMSALNDGIPVYPAWWVKDTGKCACPSANRCKSPGKHPIGVPGMAPGGQNDSTTDREVVRYWLSRFPYANVGGHTQFLTVIDMDSPDAFNWWHDHGFDLPETRVHETGREFLDGSRGKHLVYLGSSCGRRVNNLLDIKSGPGNGIILPGSMHSSGRRYTSNDVPIAALPADMHDFIVHRWPGSVKQRPSAKSRSESTRQEADVDSEDVEINIDGFEPLPHEPTWLDLPLDIRRLRFYGNRDRSLAETVYLRSCAFHRWSSRWAFLDLLDKENAAGEKLRSIVRTDPVKAVARFRRQWADAVEYVLATNETTREDLRSIHAAILGYSDWNGKQASKRKVTLALAEIAIQFGINPISKSSRDIAAYAGISRHQTVIGNLRNNVFVTVVSRSANAKSNSYFLHHAQEEPQPVEIRRSPEHDLWSTTAFGGNAHLVFDACVGRTTDELLAMLPFQKATVERHLLRLHSAGLISDTNGPWDHTGYSLEKAARFENVDGRRHEIKERFSKQREGYVARGELLRRKQQQGNGSGPCG